MGWGCAVRGGVMITGLCVVRKQLLSGGVDNAHGGEDDVT
jgi:hypothetical protein